MYERLLDKSIEPTEEELTRHCGENGGGFRELNEWLSAGYDTVREIRFPYGKSYGWCVTHRRGKKLVCDIFAEAEAFTVMLRLSDRQYSAAYPALGPRAREYIDNRYPCGDGGWIHYRVASGDDLRDIRTLLSVKCG